MKHTLTQEDYATLNSHQDFRFRVFLSTHGYILPETTILPELSLSQVIEYLEDQGDFNICKRFVGNASTRLYEIARVGAGRKVFKYPRREMIDACFMQMKECLSEEMV